MSITDLPRTIVGVAVLLAITVGGCANGQPQHRMHESGDGTRIACKQCYDVIRRVSLSKSSTITRKIHACSGCKTDMVTYSDNGVAMAKCANCAPDGVPCDRCLPPENDH